MLGNGLPDSCIDRKSEPSRKSPFYDHSNTWPLKERPLSLLSAGSPFFLGPPFQYVHSYEFRFQLE